MVQDAPAKGKVSWVDLFYLGMVLLYTAFVYVGRKLSPQLDLPVAPNTTAYPAWVMSTVGLVVLAVVIIGIYRGRWSVSECGFGLKKRLWYGAPLVILAAVSGLFIQEQFITTGHFLRLVPVLLYVTGASVVLTAVPIERAIRITGEKHWFPIVVAILSGFLFTLAFFSYPEVLRKAILFTAMSGMLYYAFRSILLIIYLDFLTLAGPHYTTLCGIMVLLIYLTIAIYGLIIERSRQKKQAVGYTGS